MRRAIIALLVLCAFATLGSAVQIKKSHFNATMHTEVESADKFIASCRSTTLSGSTLYADCANKSGVYGRTSLDLNGCLGNTNGVFSCGERWSVTGNSASVSGSTITATLQKKNGSWKSSTLDLDNFLSNIDGKLVCDCTAN